MPEVAPVLHVDAPTGEPRAVALVLHGGRSTSHMRARANQLAVLRMLPFADRPAPRRRLTTGLAVARVRYRYRGWNGAEKSPVPDVEWALQSARRTVRRPAHRTGRALDGRPGRDVRRRAPKRHDSVVGLAPWIEPGDPVVPR